MSFRKTWLVLIIAGTVLYRVGMQNVQNFFNFFIILTKMAKLFRSFSENDLK